MCHVQALPDSMFAGAVGSSARAAATACGSLYALGVWQPVVEPGLPTFAKLCSLIATVPQQQKDPRFSGLVRRPRFDLSLIV